MMASTFSSPNYLTTVEVPSQINSKPGVSVLGLKTCFHVTTFVSHQKSYCQSCFFQVAQPPLLNRFKRMDLSIRSSLDPMNPSPSDSSNGRTRLIRAIQSFRTKLGSRIQEIRKNFPMKLLFFFIGFYCATAFATVIGQTGDWDILSAALAVVVVEGIGALMYKASLPLLNKIRSLVSMFNYWKAGLSLGLFLDSFKY